MVGLTDRNAQGASLAACQKDAIAPAPVGVAVQVVCDVAGALARAAASAGGKPGVHGCIAPDNVILGYDGGVTVASAALASQRVDTRVKPDHLAPEQVSGGDIDRRADVFSLGVVCWEMLAGTRLFARQTASETRIAIIDDPILDVRHVSPDVPAAVADVLTTALQRDRNARFATPEAFAQALAGAATSSGVAAPTKQQLGAWVAERAPHAAATAPAAAPVAAPVAAPAAIPDFDVPGASRAHRSLPKMEAVKVPSAPDLAPRSIPAFDVNAMAAAALAPSVRPPAVSAPPPSSAGSGRSIAFDPGGDDDDFDMEIERNVATHSIPTATATSGRPPGVQTSARPPAGQRVAGTGLELSQPSRMARAAAARDDEESSEPSAASKLLAFAVAAPITAGTAFALWKYVRHAGGFDITRMLPHAFDGTSVTASGVISLVWLVAAVIVGFVGLRFKPTAWAVVAAGGALLLLALAMVTVTLASTGENPTPPDGALLVPYLFPATILMLALGVMGRSVRLFAVGGGARRAGAVPVAVLAGAIVFLAFEASRFAR